MTTTPQPAQGHTPTPWKIRDCDGSIGSIETMDGEPVAQVQMVGSLGRQSNGTVTQRQKTTEFIVQACNQHAALVASRDELAEALRSVDEMFSMPGKVNKSTVMAKVRKALANLK